MKTRILSAVTLLALSLGLSSVAQADDLFVLLDESGNLPFDPGDDIKDSLDVELADVDGDGDLDMFVMEGSASLAAFQNLLWINDGSGRFTDETAARLPLTPNNSTEIDLADVDGDGDLDAVVSNLGANQLLINDGAGVFTEAPLPQATPPGPPGFGVGFPPFFIEISAEAIFADVDGDGDSDIVISNENPFPFGPPGDANRLLINDGSGTFTDESARIPFAIDNTSGFAPGDIDSDGDLDFIVGNIGQNKVFVNDGSGFFNDETAARLPALSDSTRKVVLADMDGDGDLDLVVGNSRNEQDLLYFNDGSGRFTDVTTSNMPQDAATNTDIDVVDFDGDGSLDIFVTNVGDFVFGHGFLGEPNRIYLNDGSGGFEDATFPSLALRDGRSTNADLGDVNGDGVIDIVVANSGGVDQPGLPPPDGAERLFIRKNCDANTTLCHQTMLDGLASGIDGLSTLPSDGDMASRNEKVNRIRRSILAFRADRAQSSLNRNRPFSYGIRLLQIEGRVDGHSRPRDWVLGDAAGMLDGYSDFSLRVLFSYGL